MRRALFKCVGLLIRRLWARIPQEVSACATARVRCQSQAGAVLRTTARLATTRVAIVQLIAQRNENSELPPTSDHNDGCAPRLPRELRRSQRMMRARVARRAAAAQVVDVCRMRIGIVTTSTTQLGNVACALE